MASPFEVEQPGLAEAGQPAGDPALHRAQRDIQQLSGLGLALVVEIPEHEHGALARWQRRERAPRWRGQASGPPRSRPSTGAAWP